MERVTIVVPTYWGAPGNSLYQKEEVVFDHPTQLDTDGTLGRFLESLDILENRNFHVVVIAVPNSQEVTAAVIEKVLNLIEPFSKKCSISVLHPGNLETLRNQLEQEGLSNEALDLLNLQNYAAVRNICSLAGILNGSPLTIFIDDDEVFTDPYFLDKARAFIGRKHNGEVVRAIAGYYLQPDSYRIENKTSPDWAVPQWDKVTAMNRAFDAFIGRPPRLKKTPFVFGGNMVIEKETLIKVPFDPHITRGEDIDFLINLRINGINFYLDNELAIKHLPPHAHRPEWKNLREDVVRFLYEKKKLTDHSHLPGLKPADFMPYPGIFLQDDLEQRIMETATKLRTKYEQEEDLEGVEACNSLIEMARANPFQQIDTRTWIIQLTGAWQELTAACDGKGIPE